MKALQTISALALALAFSASATPAFAADDAYSLTLKDHKFSPADFTIPAGKKVKVTVKNLDATPAEFESDDFKAEKVIPAGKQVDVYIGPLKAGTYEFHDEYHEAESKTRLTVK
ncbi:MULTISPECIES: cupredoxin domain-containing protein [unclassified Burkholderia]|uniref:cupredoxin domain-containing protein n=1 Tax=unclassified Burkholderia TaxID=2613784 RepID=UPI00075AEF71|nr:MULTISPECIES: cupredoxin domain-containing protein [unclassified Burkholderia]KVN07769.1 cupredoxin-like domain protein [Burkholderia sp. MSMB1552]KWZ49726.1 cupredoxin-like domain protein [Burkholderia sp. MSMB1588]